MKRSNCIVCGKAHAKAFSPLHCSQKCLNTPSPKVKAFFAMSDEERAEFLRNYEYFKSRENPTQNSDDKPEKP